MPIDNNIHVNRASYNSIDEVKNPVRTDVSYKIALQEALGNKYAIVFAGHSGNGYLNSEAVYNHMHQQLLDVMQDKGLNPTDIAIVAGGTPQGIGLVYSLADELRMNTVGIVASAGENYCSDRCNKIIVVQNQDPHDWATKMPESGEEMVVAALRIACEVGLGAEMQVYNGGPQAYKEAGDAVKAGFPLTVFGEFDPVDIGRPQPFKDENSLQVLRDAGAKVVGKPPEQR
ncbi:hypothetical protein E5C26_20210 [Serratia proteamaculans]|uniref:hypothetical protein n=1 Tax=Serratia proteamaculans TaxID=28151 RepID=UPI001076945F|nr:hypothetical protein [Serratia proteamaculans]TFZ48667.1 hypothetical protein E5C26_20210 [Serratia proteamaculans]